MTFILMGLFVLSVAIGLAIVIKMAMDEFLTKTIDELRKENRDI